MAPTDRVCYTEITTIEYHLPATGEVVEKPRGSPESTQKTVVRLGWHTLPERYVPVHN